MKKLPRPVSVALVALFWLALGAPFRPSTAWGQADPNEVPGMPEPPVVAIVDDTRGDGVPLRDWPNGAVIRHWQAGTLMTALGEIKPGRDGFMWRRVRDPQGTAGWIRADNLLPLAVGGDSHGLSG